MLTYQDLTGAKGRAAYFRADRHRAKDLFAKVAPKAHVGDCALGVHDVSMSGLAVFADVNQAVGAVGDRIDLELRFRQRPFYAGPADIARRERTARGFKLGLRIVDGYLDIERMVRLHDEVALNRGLTEAAINHDRHVAPIYRRLCADVVYMLRRYRRILEPYEQAAQPGDGDAIARQGEVYSLCEDRFIAEFRAHWREGNEIVADILPDPVAVASVKQFTEAVVTPELVAGPIWRRAYEKPLGYPGDYQIMNYVYGDEPKNIGAFAWLCHKVGVEVGKCVATRMEMLAHEIADTIDAGNGDGRPREIASLGCGPAREIVEYLGRGAPARPVRFTLIDQDHDALSHAYEAIHPHISKLGGQATANYLHLSFGQLFRSPELVDRIAPQHLIYSAGVADYLPVRQAQLLIAGLYNKLAPGGTLVVGNMKAPTDNVWPLKFILDWELLYRTEAEMYHLATAVPAATVDLRLDPTGHNYLLYLQA